MIGKLRSARISGARVRSWVTVGGVLAAAGLLFVASGIHALQSGDRRPQNLAALVEDESARVDLLTEHAAGLNEEINTLTLSEGVNVPELPPRLAEREDVAAGSAAVSGPGLTVSLDDAPPSAADTAPGDPHPNQLVVHQQDLQAVINALWAGGAEAMTLQGERVTSTSAFRCSGNILLLHGKVFSPPYEVTAIGNRGALSEALDENEDVQVYRAWADVLGLGWNVQAHDRVEISATQSTGELRYAQVPEGTDLFA